MTRNFHWPINGQDAWSEREEADHHSQSEMGSIDLALNFVEMKAVKALMKASGTDKNVQDPLRELAGGKLGEDALAVKAKAAYGRAMKSGKIRVN